MDYKALYERLMFRASARTLVGYKEKHHIVPKCLGGSDDAENIAILTAREHYFAHQLLVKIHPGVRGLSYAAYLMGKKSLIGKYASRRYQWIKEKFIKDHGDAMRGKPRSASSIRGLAATWGKPKSASHRAAVSRARMGTTLSPETRAKIAEANKGRIVTAETRAKLSLVGKGHKRGLGNKSRTGMVNSAEARAKIGKAHAGRKRPDDWRLAISKGQAKVPDDVVMSLRSEYESGSSISKISRRYGVSRSNVNRIAKRQTYRWVA